MNTMQRTARKSHVCGCGAVIRPGNRYLVHTEFPGDDGGGFADSAGHPVRLVECAKCAVLNGRPAAPSESEGGEPT